MDFSYLVGCVDYKIPQTLRALDIIQYNEELANLVDNKCEITVSSMFEVEIRASMIVVIDYIKSRLCDTKAIDINEYFFLASSKIKVKKPFLRIFYFWFRIIFIKTLDANDGIFFLSVTRPISLDGITGFVFSSYNSSLFISSLINSFVR